jgi:hypothetical protein
MQCASCQTENDPEALACSTAASFSPAVKRGSLFAGRYEILTPSAAAAWAPSIARETAFWATRWR